MSFGLSAGAIAGIAAGAGALGGSIISGNAAKSAAGTQAAAADRATAETAREFDATQARMQPWVDAGASVLPQLTSGLAPGGDFNRDFTLADFVKDPGYQFRMDQGQQALERSAAARGGVDNGGVLKAIARYGQDYASGEYSNAYNRFNADRTTRFNRLSALAGTGQTTASQLGQLGAQASGQISSNIIGAGNARAAGQVGQANAINNGISSLGNFYMQQQFLNRLPVAGGQPSVSPVMDTGWGE